MGILFAITNKIAIRVATDKTEAGTAAPLISVSDGFPWDFIFTQHKHTLSRQRVP